MADKVVKSEAEWREVLSAEQYHVLREKGTERPFTGATWDSKTAGTYHCAACGRALFDAAAKFESHSGWPSFFQPVSADCVSEERDTSHGMIRAEVLCAKCDSHLGHVFDDGPAPTGLRYCMNSAAMKLVPEGGE